MPSQRNRSKFAAGQHSFTTIMPKWHNSAGLHLDYQRVNAYPLSRLAGSRDLVTRFTRKLSSCSWGGFRKFPLKNVTQIAHVVQRFRPFRDMRATELPVAH
jgi:hypothetical protein